MSKPPPTPPHSDVDGVHRDGTRPSKPLPPHGQDGEDLERAARETVGRPDYEPDVGGGGDNRTG